MGLLLTGISPRAARALFDKEFAPFCLEASLRQNFNKLKDLKDKKYINQNQWYLLFPRFPDVPMSSTFDVTLIITLLRNLTNVNSPHGGFDKLPTANETTTGSDLARIKVGGQSLKQECDQLKTKILDQTNKEIILEIKNSKSQIEELKSEMKKLKAEQDEVIPKNIRGK
ncbi:unnamed protein product [Mytilus edulis]|uniref:DZIP3-like HEPN domain-containing protein n=1 Tax=Mytilus edulis TaxID=6550 RepID=A0A8S3PYS9_MYTED|nr:unnamed protein product [Mytilus edulis]